MFRIRGENIKHRETLMISSKIIPVAPALKTKNKNDTALVISSRTVCLCPFDKQENTNKTLFNFGWRLFIARPSKQNWKR